jgi:ubiquinone/menaquinone biosynthesis C-methylase UbiE
LLDFLAEEIDVEGVDASAEMLDVVRTKARTAGLPEPVLHQQRLETLALPRTYATILGASSALQLITDLEAVHDTARRIHDHLRPRGTFAGSFAFEWRPGDPIDTGWELLFEKQRPTDGAPVRS